MKLQNDIMRTVKDFGEMPDASTYLGPVKYRLTGANVITSSGEWHVSCSRNIPAELASDRIYLPDDFDDLVASLASTPLRKNGLPDNHESNMSFLKSEVLGWLGLNLVGDYTRYDEMWAGVPNISKYQAVASSRVDDLTKKVPYILDGTLCSETRSFELRFPVDYCPISWGFYIDSSTGGLRAFLTFRSLEVSRNLLNDLYLFYLYFGYIFGKSGRTPFSIPVISTQIFALDAHIIDFG